MASSARGDADGVDWVVVCVRRAAAGGRGLGGTGKRRRTGKKLEKDCVGKFCDSNFLEGSKQKRLMSRSGCLQFSIGRSDGYQAIDDVEGFFCKDGNVVSSL